MGKCCVRNDKRRWDELRPIRINRNYTKFAEGSVLIEYGDTKVLCNATIENKVPQFRRNTGKGWLTAEYSLLPRSTVNRIEREAVRSRQTSRTHEIQRIIARSLKATIDLDAIGERTIWVDTDVLQADGGSRTAALTGGFLAVHDALNRFQRQGIIAKSPIKEYIAAVSVGVVDGEILLDLSYEEDVRAEVNMNVVMTNDGKFIDIVTTANEGYFEREQFDKMLDVAQVGLTQIFVIQKQALGLNNHNKK